MCVRVCACVCACVCVIVCVCVKSINRGEVYDKERRVVRREWRSAAAISCVYPIGPSLTWPRRHQI